VKPTISVVMPAYNAAPYLREAIASIVGQTERDFELILINDGSTDATHAIAQEFCAADPRIRYFTQDNCGLVATLNRGLELCRGEFIARMDADDIALPQRFEKQLALLRRKPDLVICGTAAILFGDVNGKSRKPTSDRSCRSWQLLGPAFVHPTVMFRRSVVDRGIRYRSEFLHAEDYEFWFQLAALGGMENIREPLLRYRFHGGQVTSTKRLPQQRMHVEIARTHLAAEGIPVDRQDLHDILWPETSDRPRLRVLWSAMRLFARMVARGKAAPVLMAATACNILRHERTPARR